MTEWNEHLDQALNRYANPPRPDELEARLLARAQQKRRRRWLLIFAPSATACAAAIVAAVMLLHEAPVQRQANETVTVTNSKNAGAPVGVAQQAQRISPALRARLARSPARPRRDASMTALSPVPVFPAPLPLTAEERRMQTFARDNRAIVPPDEPELVISQLDVQPLNIQQQEPGANDEQTEP